MNLPKVTNIVQLMKSLDELYCLYRLDEKLGFTWGVQQLSTSKYYRISVNSNIAYIEMLDREFSGCTELLYFDANTDPFYPEIWDDARGIFPTRYPYDMCFGRGIRRASYGRFDKMAQTYPLLPKNQSLEEDIIEPIIFQNLTRYTMNEVLTQIIALMIFPINLTEYERDEKEFFCTMKLDYRVMDLLSEEEIDELNAFVQKEIQERTEV